MTAVAQATNILPVGLAVIIGTSLQTLLSGAHLAKTTVTGYDIMAMISIFIGIILISSDSWLLNE